jgi:hypothetical protein
MTRRTCWLAPLAILTLVTTLPQGGPAQFISPGLMAGGSLSTFTGNTVSDVKQYAGFIAGAFVRIGLAGFAVQPGVYYTTKGVESSDFSETTGTGSKEALDYIQIPIVIRLHFGPIYVGAGPAVGFKLGCKITLGAAPSSGQDCEGNSGDYNPKSLEYTGILEAGLQFGKFSLGGRADLGLSNVVEAANSGNASAVDAKTRTVSVVAAIRL